MDAVAVLIPAYDCAATIADVVTGARRHVPTRAGRRRRVARRHRGRCAAAAGAEVLRQPVNAGKGAALRAGMQRLAARGRDPAPLTMDGDGQHLADRDSGAAGGVGRGTGTRSSSACARSATRQVTPMRLFGNRFANRWVEIACGRRCPTRSPASASIRCRRPCARRHRRPLRVRDRGADPRRAGGDARSRSVPVAVYYPPAAERVSHYRPFADTVRIIAVVVGLILRRPAEPTGADGAARCSQAKGADGAALCSGRSLDARPVGARLDAAILERAGAAEHEGERVVRRDRRRAAGDHRARW